MDPVIQALIDKLPNPDAEWGEDAQFAWLEMLAHAMSMAYGGRVIDRLRPMYDVSALPSPTEFRDPPKAATGPAPVEPDTRPAKHKFHIDQSGYVRNSKTANAVNPEDIDDEIFDKRGEKGDLSEVIWANGEKGVAGLDLTIVS